MVRINHIRKAALLPDFYPFGPEIMVKVTVVE
jgi:hypothetical protein